jgi:hypothetical protein
MKELEGLLVLVMAAPDVAADGWQRGGHRVGRHARHRQPRSSARAPAGVSVP